MKDNNKNTKLNNENTAKAPKKRKKIMYVPDNDVLDFGRTASDEKAAELAETITEADLDSTIQAAPIELEEAANPVETEDVESAEDKTVKETDTATDNTEQKPTKKKNVFVRVIGAIFPKKGDPAKRIVLKVTSIVAALAILASGGYLIYYFGDLGVQNQVIQQQRALYDLNRYDYNTETAEGYLAKFSELKRQNNDLVGWITIEGTEVDNPIYQRDNDFYLNHDMNGKSNSYGSLFLDERCDLYPSRRTQNQIIYGHNMRYGAMFGTLDEYRKLDYYKAHPNIAFDSLWEHNEYKIFAIMITNDSVDNTFGYNFTAYRNNFVNQEDFLLWTEYCKQRSIFDIDVDILPDDEVITLSTCCYDFNEARFIIVGRKVRPGESSEVDVESASKNKDVIYSKEYYEKKKLPIPKVDPPTVNVYDR